MRGHISPSCGQKGDPLGKHLRPLWRITCPKKGRTRYVLCMGCGGLASASSLNLRQVGHAWAPSADPFSLFPPVRLQSSRGCTPFCWGVPLFLLGVYPFKYFLGGYTPFSFWGCTPLCLLSMYPFSFSGCTLWPFGVVPPLGKFPYNNNLPGCMIEPTGTDSLNSSHAAKTLQNGCGQFFFRGKRWCAPRVPWPASPMWRCKPSTEVNSSHSPFLTPACGFCQLVVLFGADVRTGGQQNTARASKKR